MGLELKEIVEQNLEDHDGLGTGILPRGRRARDHPRRARRLRRGAGLAAEPTRARRSSAERLEAMNERIDEIAAGESRRPSASAARRTRGRRRRRAGARAPPRSDAHPRHPRAERPRLLPGVAARLEARHRHRVGGHARRRDARRRADAARATPPSEPLLVFVAFVVAVGSLMLQGFTLPWLVRLLRFERSGDGPLEQAEQATPRRRAAGCRGSRRRRLRPRRGGTARRSRRSSSSASGRGSSQPPDDDMTAYGADVLELRLALIEVMRTRLNDAVVGRRVQHRGAAARARRARRRPAQPAAAARRRGLKRSGEAARRGENGRERRGDE